MLVRTIQDQEIVSRDIEGLEGDALSFVNLIQVMEGLDRSNEASSDY